jgi:aldehyde:ferredoxin oxidoreductase
MYAHTSKILKVNLSDGSITHLTVDENIARQYIGGRGLAARLLFDMMPTGCDPLGPQNKLVFMTGPLAATRLAGSARYVVMALSPLTNFLGESYAGGSFAHQLKRAGFDGIVIEGQSPRAVYLVVDSGQARLHEGEGIWGLETKEARDRLVATHGKDFDMALIGPAGERQILFACIMQGLGRAAGRTGMGAVMGSKRLKAVLVRGNHDPALYNKAGVNELVKANARFLIEHPSTKGFRDFGTGRNIDAFNELGNLPTQNFREGSFEHFEKISGETFMKVLVRKESCIYCPVRCKKVVEISGSPYGDVLADYGGPEYETIASLGSLCMNEDLAALCMAHQLCNAYGVDTISMGVVAAFAMECYERGLISCDDVGFEIHWGDPRALLRLIKLTAVREGFGELLCQGVQRMAEKIGKDASQYAAHVKGLEIPMHDPRSKMGLGISYAVAPRGSNHCEGFHDTFYAGENAAPEIGIVKKVNPYTLEDGKPGMVIAGENWQSFANSAIMCRFTVKETGGKRNVLTIVDALNEATGWGLSMEEVLEAGERAFNICRLLTAREGFDRSLDVLPPHFSKPQTRSLAKGNVISSEAMAHALNEYYELRGWTQEGVPKPEHLEKLGMGDVSRSIAQARD